MTQSPLLYGLSTVPGNGPQAAIAIGGSQTAVTVYVRLAVHPVSGSVAVTVNVCGPALVRVSGRPVMTYPGNAGMVVPTGNVAAMSGNAMTGQTTTAYSREP